MSVGPAYKSFVVGECSPEVAAREITGDFKNLLEFVMYSHIESTKSYYRIGYQKFLFLVRDFAKTLLNTHLTAEKESVIKYYYNRQLIVQVTMVPQKLENDSSNPFYVSVPLYKAPHYEVQTDILQLRPQEHKINYNMKYLVVIVDPFSRYVWSCPVQTLQAIKVQRAFLAALTRPGGGSQYYRFLRERIKRVVIDGGSEFKNVFPEAINLYFPNAEISTSNAKNRTGNRPTGNGPIEAAIRLVRRVIRDYSIAIEPDFLKSKGERQPHDGLTRIMFAYNNTIQIALHNKTPNEVMMQMVEPKLQAGLADTVSYVNNKRNEKILLRQQKQAMLGNTQIAKDRNGSIGYRIYIPPGQFAKEVDIKVSLKVYVISRMSTANPQYVDLIEYGDGTETKQNVLWNSLVLVKTPVSNGPPSILRNLTTTVKEWGFQKPTPKEISQPFYVSKSVMEAIGGQEDPEIRNRQIGFITEPLGYARRRNATRGARFDGDYREK